MLVGKCLCGALRYAVEGPFRYADYCHCSRCRAASGSGFSAFAGIEQDKIRVTDGADSVALFEMNPDNIVRFCKLCGSSLFALVRDGQFFHVKLGTLVEDPGIRPIFHIFVGSQAPWHEIADSLPHCAGLPLRRRPDFSRTRLQHGHQRNGGRHGTADDQNG